MAEQAHFERHMSDSDALMWNMEKDPLLRNTIAAVLVLEASPDWDALVARLDATSRLVPRLRQRVVSPPLRLGPPCYVVDRDFDLAYHLRRVVAPPPGTLRSVLDLSQSWAMGSFDRARPLWEFTLVEGLEDGRAALVMKVHHSVIDGVGGIELALRLFDPEPGSPQDEPGPAPEPERVDPLALLADAAGLVVRDSAGLAVRMPGMAVGALWSSLTDPLGTVRGSLRMTRSVAKLLAPATTMLSPVMRARSARWRYEVLDVPLDDLKRAGKAAGGSLNDAFVAAVSGGMRHYHEAHDEPVHELRMTMPVNLREAGDPLGGNRISPLRMRMPIGEPDPRRRIERVGEVCRTWREEPAVAATPAIAGVLNRLPTSVMTSVFGGMLKHVDFLTSNVPGVPGTVSLVGPPVERWYALGPTEGAAMNVTLLSYGQVCGVGLTIDPAAVPDHDVMTDAVRRGFDEVLTLVD